MLDWVLAILVPAGIVAAAAGAYWCWARFGTDRPVDHHSSMPNEPDFPDG
ncbi:hypothetical protein [Kitasatospora sp. NPDC090091]